MLQIVIFLEFWVVLAVSFFLGNPVKYSSKNIVQIEFKKGRPWKSRDRIFSKNVKFLESEESSRIFSIYADNIFTLKILYRPRQMKIIWFSIWGFITILNNYWRHFLYFWMFLHLANLKYDFTKLGFKKFEKLYKRIFETGVSFNPLQYLKLDSKILCKFHQRFY